MAFVASPANTVVVVGCNNRCVCALVFSNLVVSSTESAAAIVVESVTGREYPFSLRPGSVCRFLRGLVLDMPTVSFGRFLSDFDLG